MSSKNNIVRTELGQLQNTCFVVMPFDSLYQPYYDRVIHPAIEELGLKCIRGDEIYSKPDVVGDIWKSIRESRLIVAELTERNPNVFYEIGLAHAIGKPIIFLTRNENDVPFDLKGLRYRYYDISNPFWGENLKKSIKSMVESILDEPDLSKCLDGIQLDLSVPQKPTRPSQDKITDTSGRASIIDISGNWQGTWKDGRSWEYTGIIFITQRNEELSATMTITYQKADTPTIVQEVLVGTIKGKQVGLNGISYTYIQQGASSSYSLDSFNLVLDDDLHKMEGEFKGVLDKAKFEKTGN